MSIARWPLKEFIDIPSFLLCKSTDTEALLPTREKEEGGTVRSPGGSTQFERGQVGSLLVTDGVMQTAS